jgi:hypothetical protein
MQTAVRRAPVATLPALDQAIRLNAEVVAVGRHRLDKAPTDRRAECGFMDFSSPRCAIRPRVL